MVDKSSKLLRLSIAILVFTSHMGLGTTFRYSQISSIIPLTVILAMPIGEWLDRSFPVYRKITNLITIAMLLFLPLLALQSDLMDTVIVLFMYIQIYSMAHEKRRQEYYHVILMSFFLLVAALVMSPSAAMGLVLFFFILSGSSALLLTDWHNQIIISTPVTPDSRVNSKTKSVGTSRPLRVVPAMSLLMVAILGMTSVLFVFLPRTQAGLLGRSLRTEVYTTGLSDGIQLDVSGSIASDSSPVMRVQFKGVSDGRFDAEKYWRSTTMDKYTGTSWSRQGLSTSVRSAQREVLGYRTVPALSSQGGMVGVNRQTMSPDHSTVTYEVFVDNYPEGGFPLLSTVIDVAPKQKTRNLRMYWEQGGDFTVNLNYRSELKPYFVATSQLLRPSPDELRRSSDAYMDVMVPSDYRLLTDHGLEPRTVEFTLDLVEGMATDYDKVIVIEAYLGGAEFEYTRQIPLLDPDHPIESFIHEARAGHCELFASSMALMVRSLGVPARVVSGYRGGDWDASDKSYTITNNMAHLWVEVYFPDYGWIVFDPTPSDAELVRTSFQQFMNTMARYSLKARIFWLQYVIGFSPSESVTFFRDKAFGLIRELFAPESLEDEEIGKLAWPQGSQGVLLGLFVTALFGCTLLVTLLGVRLLKRPKSRMLNGDQLRAKQLYIQLQKTLLRLEIVGRNETAEEVAARLNCFPESVCDELRKFVDRYHDARFGLTPLSTNEFDHFRALIKNLKLPAPSH
ncbi:MAG: DUF3488 and transglutaminase-like domain-containing protein [Candidatus Hydrogenedentota bacterium]